MTPSSTGSSSTVSFTRWCIGLFLASIFSLVYLLTPLYILSTLVLLITQYLNPKLYFYIYVAPLIISILVPSKQLTCLANYMTPMLDYFQYEEILETTNEALKKLNREDGTNVIMALQPHGVVSFCSMCSWINADPEIRPIQTGVASVLLQVPILKNVMGIYGLTAASGSNVRRILQKKTKDIRGSIVLYVGGIAELFKSSRKEERLYLKSRKGFIKVALREKGVDIIPVYLFGNTSVLTVIKNKSLEKLSRSMQVSLTYFWGKWKLPIPRDDKLLYVRGKPLGMPYIPEPTDQDVDKWHGKYCEEVTRLFNTYKEKVPAYKHKTLYLD